MTFEQADKLCAKIVTFMIKCGNTYTTDRIGELQRMAIVSLATGQFVIRMRGDGSIKYFAAFWFVDDINSVIQEDPEMPSDTTSGQDMYVAEVASDGERGNTTDMIRRLWSLRKSNVYWVRVKPNKSRAVYKDFRLHSKEY